MTYTEQLEHETEQTRTQIADTLDELRACMTPGQVVNQLADRVGDAGATAFVANLKRQTIDNPVPVALIGAGLAWLMFGGRAETTGRSLAAETTRKLDDVASAVGERMRDAADTTAQTGNQSAEWSDSATKKSAEWTDEASRKGAEWGDKVVGLAERTRAQVASGVDRATQSAADTADRVRESADNLGDSTRRSASASYDALSGSARRAGVAVGQSTRAAGERVLQTSNALVDFFREQPLVLAGLGIAIGATIGALLPQTKTEDHLMGDASDQLKERAQDLAAQEYESAKKVGEHALEAAEDEATKQAGQRQEAAGYERKSGASVADEATLVPASRSEHEGPGEAPNIEHAKP